MIFMLHIHSNQRDLLSIVKRLTLTKETIRLIKQSQRNFAVDRKANKTAIESSVEQLFDVKLVSVKTSFTAIKKASSR